MQTMWIQLKGFFYPSLKFVIKWLSTILPRSFPYYI